MDVPEVLVCVLSYSSWTHVLGIGRPLPLRARRRYPVFTVFLRLLV